MSKSTVISLVPFEINEKKPLYPGHFTIPPAKDNDFEFIVIDNSVHHVYLDADRGSLTIPTISEEVARSICQDYITSQLGYMASIAEPGLFWIIGDYRVYLDDKITLDITKTKKAITAVASHQIQKSREKQKAWFIRLLEIADDEWVKYHSHRSISDLQRYASKYLGLEREWAEIGEAEVPTLCPACKSPIQSDALICGNCRTVVNAEGYKKFQQVSA